jgi:hypothetical protein
MDLRSGEIMDYPYIVHAGRENLVMNELSFEEDMGDDLVEIYTLTYDIVHDIVYAQTYRNELAFTIFDGTIPMVRKIYSVGDADPDGLDGIPWSCTLREVIADPITGEVYLLTGRVDNALSGYANEFRFWKYNVETDSFIREKLFSSFPRDHDHILQHIARIPGDERTFIGSENGFFILDENLELEMDLSDHIDDVVDIGVLGPDLYLVQSRVLTVFHTENNSFENVELTNEGWVYSIHVLEEKNILYIATTRGLTYGLIRFDPKNGTEELIPPPDRYPDLFKGEWNKSHFFTPAGGCLYVDPDEEFAYISIDADYGINNRKPEFIMKYWFGNNTWDFLNNGTMDNYDLYEKHRKWGYNLEFRDIVYVESLGKAFINTELGILTEEMEFLGYLPRNIASINSMIWDEENGLLYVATGVFNAGEYDRVPANQKGDAFGIFVIDPIKGDFRQIAMTEGSPTQYFYGMYLDKDQGRLYFGGSRMFGYVDTIDLQKDITLDFSIEERYLPVGGIQEDPDTEGKVSSSDSDDNHFICVGLGFPIIIVILLIYAGFTKIKKN